MNAECGVRNAELQCKVARRVTRTSILRTPHSAFRTGEGFMHEHHIGVSRSARYFTLGEKPQGVAEVWFACHGYGQLAARFLERLRAARLTLVYGRSDEYITPKVLAAVTERLAAHAIPYRAMPFDGGHELRDDVLNELAAA